MIDMIILLVGLVTTQAEALELAHSKIRVLEARIQEADDWIYHLEIALKEYEAILEDLVKEAE